MLSEQPREIRKVGQVRGVVGRVKVNSMGNLLLPTTLTEETKMVNVMAFIRRKKQQFHASRDKAYQAEMLNRQIELKKLEERRIMAESKAMLATASLSEKQRIRVAKEKTPGKVRSFGKGLAKVMNQGREHLKKVKASGGGIDFGGQSGGGFGSTGGGHNPFGGGGQSPFGETKPTPAVKKGTTITVHVR